MAAEAENLAAAAASGDRLVALERLRDRLASEIDSCASSRDVAALSQRFMDVLAEIAEIAPPAKPKGTPLDEFTARRTAREAVAAGKPASAARAGRRR